MMIRQLNNKGIEEFKQQIISYKRNNRKDIILQELLNSSSFSRSFINRYNIDESQNYNNRLELGRYLYELFEDVDNKMLIANVGFWTWLTALLFDKISPKDSNSKRKLGEIERYILNPELNKFYKHSVYSSWRFYSLYKEKSKIFLKSDLNIINQFSVQISLNLNILSNPEVLDVLYLLYWDYGNDNFKRGFASENNPGNVRRFPTVFNQLSLTYDLHSSVAEKIIELLPEEFDRWKNS